jgi:hypothetical protein
MKAETKAARAAQVLSWCSTPRALPQALVDALDKADAFKGGQGYHAQTPAHLLWLTRFVEHWLGTSDTVSVTKAFVTRSRSATSRHPRLETCPRSGTSSSTSRGPASSPRSSVLTIEVEDSQAALISDLGEPSGDDDRSITHDLVRAAGPSSTERPRARGRSYHVVQDRRTSGAVEPGQATSPPRAWLVRPSEDGGSALVDVLARRTALCPCRRRCSAPLNLEPTRTRGRARPSRRATPTWTPRSGRRRAAAYHSFLTLMKVDDLVATIDGGQLVGLGSSAARLDYVDDSGSRLRRDVPSGRPSIGGDHEPTLGRRFLRCWTSKGRSSMRPQPSIILAVPARSLRHAG